MSSKFVIVCKDDRKNLKTSSLTFLWKITNQFAKNRNHVISK